MKKSDLNNQELNEIRKKYQAVTRRDKPHTKKAELSNEQLYKKWEENSKSV